MTLKKIISGGQTGVDRGALDAALSVDFPVGGWCPQHRKAEDGVIPARYPLLELDGAGYPERTRKNVIDSDGTLILYFAELEGGSLMTKRFCHQHEKPCLAFDLLGTPVEDARETIVAFIEQHHIAVLNVAGPRASKQPTAQAQTRELIRAVIAADS